MAEPNAENSSGAAEPQIGVCQQALIIAVGLYNDKDKNKDKDKDKHRKKRTDGEYVRFKDLTGPTNDALAMRAHLITHHKVPESGIKILLAPLSTQLDSLPSDLDYDEPTYANIVAALKQLALDSKPNDLVYIHFSGHGARATTVFHDIRKSEHLYFVKHSEEYDHCIVPCDAPYGGPYLRDLEIGTLLQDIVEKKAIMTVTFDCCYSEGALRRGDDGQEEENEEGPSEGPQARSIDGIYASHNANDRPGDDMIRLIEKHSAADPNWMSSPSGFVFFCACGESQTAAEDWMGDGTKKHGRFTYYLLEVLKELGNGAHATGDSITGPLASDTILRLITARLNDPEQTPDIRGNRLRFFFSVGSRASMPYIYIDKLFGRRGQVGSWLQFRAGEVDLVREGSIFAILPLGHADTALSGKRRDALARVRISGVDGFTSTAVPHGSEGDRWEKVMEGYPAVLESLADKDQATVLFESSPEHGNGDWETLLQGLQKSLQDRTWLRPWPCKSPTPPTFTVAVDSTNGSYTLKSSLTNCPQLKSLDAVTGSLRHKLGLTKPEDQAILLNRLEHIFWFSNIQALQSKPNLKSRLFSLTVAPETHSRPHPNASTVLLRPVTVMEADKTTGFYKVHDQGLFTITLTNHTEQRLGLIILSLTPGFRVGPVIPREDSASFAEIPPRDRGADGMDRPSLTISELALEIPPMLADAAYSNGEEVAVTMKVIALCPKRGLDSLRLPSLWKMEELAYRGDAPGRQGPPPLSQEGGCVALGSWRREEEAAWQVETLQVLVGTNPDWQSNELQ